MYQYQFKPVRQKPKPNTRQLSPEISFMGYLVANAYKNGLESTITGFKTLLDRFCSDRNISRQDKHFIHSDRSKYIAELYKYSNDFKV